VRLVLDTNVIVAAFAARGLCAEILEVSVSGHTIVLSEYILAETQEKLTKKIKLPKTAVSDIIQYLRDVAEITTPECLDESLCRDKDDVQIIGTALAGFADYIVTGDDDLLILKAYRGIKIVTPRQLWNSLKGQ
jgi:putative PIN family toxin of toxin-antitoxin system